MPKRARQAHIPSQVRKRKPGRRPNGSSGSESYEHDEPVYADPPINSINSVPVAFGAGPVDTRPRRRLESLTRTREGPSVLRVVPGQLPTFERHYLMSELRRTSIISGALLAAIIALTFILR